MTTLETTQPLPLTLTPEGMIRINGSRVSLDSIVHHYKLGATAEEIAYKFPSLRLVDIYAAITYYLSHQPEVEDYLKQQEAEADALQQQIEAEPQHQVAITGLRERLTRRWVGRMDSQGYIQADFTSV